jgi:hypothetical protein
MPEKPVGMRREPSIDSANADDGWIDEEFSEAAFADEWLGKRFRTLLAQLSSSPGDAIPLVCQDWAMSRFTSTWTKRLT